uniref:NADH dehydrogenase subunit 6 n=1 Tax=Daphnia similis TaxID=35528 RepID=A0A510C1L9_9CRUS|nr:NADH dehydrogenase subunit 6 [Daphnia similis]AYE40157.1 NADH dehydrogenase subunit 6 [Daphnia similis]
MFSILMMVLASIFPGLNHPLSMGLVILMMTIAMAVCLGSLAVHFWVSYVLILVLLGGLLVIFIYISLLASNELFAKKNNFKTLLQSIVLSTSLLFSYSLFFWVTSEEMYLSIKSLSSEGLVWLNLLYSEQLGGVTMFLVFYLLLTLIVVVSITKNDYSSLRAR